MIRLKHPRVGTWLALVLLLTLLLLPYRVMAESGEPQEGGGENRCQTVHKIALGENLTMIAAQYEVTVEALIEENGIEDANLIVENQALCIPARSRGDYSEWSNYGVPGKAYDPSVLIKQKSNGPQEQSYGNQGGWQPEAGYGVPGKAYDPSAKQNSGYWKDDLQYPYPYSSGDDSYNNDDEEAEEPTGAARGEVPPDYEENGENGENGTHVH